MSEENDVIRAQQEKSLGKLKWLIERAKPDFKGNLPPFVKPKTRASVDQAKKQADRFMQGETFEPYGHAAVPLSMDATRVIKHEPVVVSPSEVKKDHHTVNKYHQVLDPNTGRPEVYEIFHFNKLHHAERATGRKRFPESSPSSENDVNSKDRSNAKVLDMATPQQRLQLLRAEALSHPKFSASSRIERANQFWDPTSQLPNNAILSPPRKDRAPLINRRNEIRMIGIMRRTASSASWK